MRRRPLMPILLAATAVLGYSAWGAAQEPEQGRRRIERVRKGDHGQAAGQRWAVVVGVDRYESPDIEPLSGAVADARAIRDVLIDYADFPQDQVFLLVSDGDLKPTPGNIMERLEQIKTVAQPDHLLLVFFAGHGVQVDGQRYLLCYDTRISSTARLKTTALPATVLMQELQAIPVLHRLVMVDACRNDPTQGGRPNIADEALEMAFTLRGEGEEGGVRATFLSSSRGQSAYEWQEQERGFFSYFIEQGLMGEAAQFGKVTVTSLLTYLNEMVPQKVREQRNQLQIPYARVAGSELILTREDKVEKASGLDQPIIVTARTIYGVVKDSAGVPLTGASVRVAIQGGGRAVAPPPEPTALAAVTDEDGFFKLDGVPPDVEAAVFVDMDGYASRTLSAPPEEAGKKLRVFLARETPVMVASAAPVAAPEPAPVAAPEPAPVAAPEPAPVVAPEPAPVVAPEPAPVVAPEPAPVVAPEPAPVVAPEPAPVVAPEPTSTTRPTPKPATRPLAEPPPAHVAVAEAAEPVPDPPPAHTVRAAELAAVAYRTFLAEDFSEAVEAARDALGVDPENALANAVLGNALVAIGANTGEQELIAEAGPAITKALSLDDELALGHNARALEYLAGGELVKARSELARAVELDPKLAPAHANLAYVLARTEELKDAERQYRVAIELSPDSAVPYNGLSDVLFRRRKYKDAVKASRDAISRYELRDSLMGLFYVQLAVTQFSRGDRDEAVGSVARARALGVESHPAYEVIESDPDSRKKDKSKKTDSP